MAWWMDGHSCTDFPPRHLSTNGKQIMLLTAVCPWVLPSGMPSCDDALIECLTKLTEANAKLMNAKEAKEAKEANASLHAKEKAVHGEVKKWERRGVLIDDKVKYHLPQPDNGVLVSPFTDTEGTQYDYTLLRLWSLLIVRCGLSPDVRNVLKPLRTPNFTAALQAYRRKRDSQSYD